MFKEEFKSLGIELPQEQLYVLLDSGISCNLPHFEHFLDVFLGFTKSSLHPVSSDNFIYDCRFLNCMLSKKIRDKISKSMKDRKLSEEHKRNIGLSTKQRWLNNKYRENISNKLKGKNNPNKRQEVRDKLSIITKERMKEKKVRNNISTKLKKYNKNPEVLKRKSEFLKKNNPMKEQKNKDKISKARSEFLTEQILNGKYFGSYGKKGFFYSKKNNKKLFYRSLYELKAYHLLEKDDGVYKYEIETIKIPYTKDGRKHYCIPDILVNNIKIIEVKPKFKIKYEQHKIDIIKNYCKRNNLIFEIWSEDEINKLVC